MAGTLLAGNAAQAQCTPNAQHALDIASDATSYTSLGNNLETLLNRANPGDAGILPLTEVPTVMRPQGFETAARCLLHVLPELHEGIRNDEKTLKHLANYEGDESVTVDAINQHWAGDQAEMVRYGFSADAGVAHVFPALHGRRLSLQVLQYLIDHPEVQVIDPSADASAPLDVSTPDAAEDVLPADVLNVDAAVDVMSSVDIQTVDASVEVDVLQPRPAHINRPEGDERPEKPTTYTKSDLITASAVAGLAGFGLTKLFGGKGRPLSLADFMKKNSVTIKNQLQTLLQNSKHLEGFDESKIQKTVNDLYDSILSYCENSKETFLSPQGKELPHSIIQAACGSIIRTSPTNTAAAAVLRVVTHTEVQEVRDNLRVVFQVLQGTLLETINRDSTAIEHLVEALSIFVVTKNSEALTNVAKTVEATRYGAITQILEDYADSLEKDADDKPLIPKSFATIFGHLQNGLRDKMQEEELHQKIQRAISKPLQEFFVQLGLNDEEKEKVTNTLSDIIHEDINSGRYGEHEIFERGFFIDGFLREYLAEISEKDTIHDAEVKKITQDISAALEKRAETIYHAFRQHLTDEVFSRSTVADAMKELKAKADFIERLVDHAMGGSNPPRLKMESFNADNKIELGRLISFIHFAQTSPSFTPEEKGTLKALATALQTPPVDPKARFKKLFEENTTLQNWMTEHASGISDDQKAAFIEALADIATRQTETDELILINNCMNLLADEDAPEGLPGNIAYKIITATAYS
ncbi:MAG: hypothetical protein IPJ69_04755 [Deltaproteobacteria bacterium]|nr:MAG: hypothetical protein IPJ69_04755 [Deltaproteobacteria bacterium]